MAKLGRPRYPDILTPREWDVLALLRDGLSNQQIAERLAITERTAKYHVAEILGKLGVSSREEAAQWQPEEAPGWALLGVPFVFIWKKATFAGLAAAGAGATFIGVASVAALLTWGSIRTTDGDGSDMANLSSPSVFEAATPSSEQDSQDSGFSLEGVNLADLEGISLSAVEPGFQPKVSMREAEEIATQSPGLSATVRDSLLAYVSGLQHDREAWMISLDGRLAPGPQVGVVKYLVAFVDASTGEWYLTTTAQSAPPGGWPSYGLSPYPLSAPGELP